MIGGFTVILVSLFSFIKHADFTGKPFDALFDEAFFSWKDINSNPNPDGIIRMPFRGIYLLASYLFGSEVGAYAFIASILIFSFIAFYFFCRSFLGQKSILFAVVVSLMFTFNPVFLGNFSKIGLQMGVACLPLLLVFLKKYYTSQRFMYLLAVPILLIASLVHPFTFIVNGAVVAVYAIMKWKAHRLAHLLLIGVVGGLLSAYFVLPQVMMGSVSRSQIESSDTSGDYDSLLNIANTESVFEGIVNAKSVFVDYTFFNPTYSPVFYISNLVALLIIITALVYAYKAKDRLTIAISVFLIVYIGLVLLADLGSELLRTAIAYLIGLPGGWAFRSPLKWQLYIPLVLYAAYMLSLVVLRRYKRTMIVASVLIFAGFNFHLFTQVYVHLLHPKEFKNFASFSKEPFDNARLLYVKNFECGQYLLQSRQVSAEIGFILGTSSIQTTTTSPDRLQNYDFKDFEYVIDCTHSPQLAAQRWQVMDSHDVVRIYKTNTTVAKINLTNTIHKAQDVNTTKLNDILERLSYGRGVFVDDERRYDSEIVEVFGTIKQSNFSGSELRVGAQFSSAYTEYKLLSGIDLTNQSISVNGNQVRIENQDFGAKGMVSQKQIPGSQAYSVSYKGDTYKFVNMIQNPTFAQGMWKSKVSDCFAFDSKPKIDAKINRDGYRDRAALELYALRHLACTEPAKSIPVKSGATYFLSFFAKALQGQQLRYLIVFDDPANTQVERNYIFENKESWEEITGFITAPQGATTARLVLYAPPVAQGISPSRILFDDFFLVETPDFKDSIFLMGSKPKSYRTNKAQVEKINPTLYRFTVRSIDSSAAQYILLHEDYHNKWKVRFDQPGVEVAEHTSDLANANVWRLRCITEGEACPQLVSGYIEFAPQKYYGIGAMISGVTFACLLTYAVFDSIRHRRRTARVVTTKTLPGGSGAHHQVSPARKPSAAPHTPHAARQRPVHRRLVQ